MTAPLEDRLVDLGPWLDAPAGDGLAVRVGARVRARRGRSTRRRVALVLAVLVVLVLVGSLVPAVGEWLGVRGVEVRQEAPPGPTPSSAPVGSAPFGGSLDLGSPSTLAAARVRAGFDVLVPASLGAPAAVWLDTRPRVPIVTLAYPGGRLVSEFRAAIADGPVLRKFGGPGVRIEEIDVEGHRAVWIEGVHEVAVEVPGEVFGDRLRLSDSALLVEVGDVTARVETRFGRDDAVAMARNLVRAAGVDGP